mgnify:CR=1 FL=1
MWVKLSPMSDLSRNFMDSSGKMLSNNQSDPLAQSVASQADFQRKYENGLEQQIERMLSRVVGEGKVAAKVSADVDFSQTSEVQTTYDADGAALAGT